MSPPAPSHVCGATTQLKEDGTGRTVCRSSIQHLVKRSPTRLGPETGKHGSMPIPNRPDRGQACLGTGAGVRLGMHLKDHSNQRAGRNKEVEGVPSVTEEEGVVGHHFNRHLRLRQGQCSETARDKTCKRGGPSPMLWGGQQTQLGGPSWRLCRTTIRTG